MAWGGSTILCTRNVKFELNDHKDCSGSGLTATGFVTVELTGSSGTTVQLKKRVEAACLLPLAPFVAGRGWPEAKAPRPGEGHIVQCVVLTARPSGHARTV